MSRLYRERVLTSEALELAAANLKALQSAWYEVSPTEEVRTHARRILRVHALRAADALQLAAAVTWATHFELGEFVSFDDRLRESARAEGFSVLRFD